MIVTNTAREKNTVTFDVTLDAAEFEKFVNGAYQKNKGKITVQGFRKGHAPRMVIEGMYGKDAFYDDAMNDAAPEAISYAIEQEKLEIVGRPAVEKADVTEENGLAFSFKVDVWPEVTLGQYKGLEAEKLEVYVTDENVDEELERLRKQNSRLVTAERAAALHDTVNIDYAGTVDGVAFDGGAAEGHNLVLGSNAFIPGFEEQVVGMSADEERDITVTFPQEYVEHLAGKEAVFHVKCNEVKEEILPAVDDEFAKDNDYDTLDELKANIRARLQEGRQKSSDSAFEDDLVNQACDNMTVEIPDSMIEERMDSIVREYSQYMSAQGMNLDDYLKYSGADFNTFRDSTRGAAEQQTRTDVLIRAIIEAEKLEATEEELERETADVAAQYGMKVEDVKKAINMDAVKEQVLRRKAIKLISDSAVAVAPKEETKEESKKKTRKKTKAEAPAAEDGKTE